MFFFVYTPVMNSISKWIKRKKTKQFNFRIDIYTLAILKKMNKDTKTPRSEIIRRSIYFTKVLFDPNFKLGDIVTEQNWNKTLGDILIPIPELAHQINLDSEIKQTFKNNDT